MGKKSVNNLYKPMLEHSNVEQKFHKAAKGKSTVSQRKRKSHGTMQPQFCHTWVT